MEYRKTLTGDTIMADLLFAMRGLDFSLRMIEPDENDNEKWRTIIRSSEEIYHLIKSKQSIKNIMRTISEKPNDDEEFREFIDEEIERYQQVIDFLKELKTSSRMK